MHSFVSRKNTIEALLHRIIISFLTMALASPAIHGASKIWQATGPEGGVINSIVIDPQHSETLYIALYAGGVFKSTDGGSNWFAAYRGLDWKDVLDMAINPQHPAILYAGTAAEGVYRTTDGGISWRAINSGLAAMGINALAIDPVNPSIVYAGSSSGGVFKTVNGGENWTAINNSLLDHDIQALTLDTQNPEILYAGTESHGIYKSTNGGTNWSAINSGLNNNVVRRLAINPQNPQVVYAGTHYGDGIYRTTDGGEHWGVIGDNLANSSVRTIAVDPQNPGIVYAGSDSGFFKSTDGGDHFSSLGNMPDAFVALAIDGQNSAIVYAAGFASGIYKSANRGTTWQQINNKLFSSYVEALAIDPQNASTVYAGTQYGGVSKSTNSGLSWNSANTGISTSPFIGRHIQALAIDPQNPDILYAAENYGGVHKSTDGGASWSPRNNGFPTQTLNVRVVGIDPQNPSILYAGTDGFQSYKSTNGGNAWVPFDSPKIGVLAINPQNPAILYAGAETGYGAVFKSTDAGLTWNRPNGAIAEQQLLSLVIDPQNPSTVYAGMYFGIFKTTDGGDTWIAANDGLPQNLSVYCLAIDPQNTQTLYAGSWGSGIFRSTNGGESWSAFSQGMPDYIIVRALAVSPSAQKRLYAGTTGLGVWTYSPGCSSLSSNLNAGSAAACETIGNESTTKSGYAKLTLDSGSTPFGTAVLSFKQDGVIVSEAGVPASPPTIAARIFIDYRSDVSAVPSHTEAGSIDINTGIAVVNHGAFVAHVVYTLRDISGRVRATGNGTIAAGGHFACFIDHLADVAAPDFILPPDFGSTMQFASLEVSADQPFSILALRGTTNQQNHFLMTTTPIADRMQPSNSEPIYFPQFVDGGGYTTSLILMNTSEEIESGVFYIRDKDGNSLAVHEAGGGTNSSFTYSIPSHGVYRFQTDGSPVDIKAGWVHLVPDAGTTTPVGSGIFGYNPGNVLISESGIPSASATTHARIYVDLSENHNTGLAIANTAEAGTNVAVQAFEIDGVTPALADAGSIALPAHGYKAAFVDGLITLLPPGFTGVLDISSSTPIAALTLRSLLNDRDEFLMTTFPIADANRAAPSPVVFPQLADGGGYTTQFMLISMGDASGISLDFYNEDGTGGDF
jgi:photosystem II stability/assembly factor-like uncharacterized protein